MATLDSLEWDDLERYAYQYATTPLEKALLAELQQAINTAPLIDLIENYAGLDPYDLPDLEKELDRLFGMEAKVDELNAKVTGLRGQLEDARTLANDTLTALENIQS